MADGGDALLFDLANVRPVAGACQAPIGRRHASRPRSRHASRPSPTLALLAELRSMLAALTADQSHRFRHLDRATGRQARTIAEIAEAFERILARLVAVERALGVCETPAAPRPTRRQPVQ